jgi:hypothetical protein
MNNLPETRRHWYVKHVARFGPVGKMMHRRKEWATPSCPCCNSAIEDSLHVWLCPADTQREIRAKHLEKLSDWMAAYPTDPEINDVIIQRLDEWLAGEPSAEIPDIHPDVMEALRQQDEAGWELPFTGMWLQAWIPLQQTFLSHRNTRKTAKRWLAGIIKRLVDMSWSLWEQRNHTLHDQDSTRAQDMANEAIRRYYDMPRGVFPPHLQRRFGNLDELLGSSLPRRKAWLAAMETYSQFNPQDTLRNVRQRRRLTQSLGGASIPRPVRPTTPSITTQHENLQQAIRSYRQNPAGRSLSQVLRSVSTS